MTSKHHGDNQLDWQPLKGLIVLDVSQGIAGPYCAAILGSQGATVYKVEPPTGDWGRHVGTRSPEMSALTASVNGTKQSICIDAALPAGIQLLTRLALKADILIESFRPGVAARLGLDRAELQQARPDQIMLSVSGFGETGPGAKRPGSDSVLQAMTGAMHLNATSDGIPRMIPMHLIDFAAALYCSQLLTLAIMQRGQTGEGRHLKVSLLEVAAAFQVIPQLESSLKGQFPAGHLPVPSGVFQTLDGYIRITTLTQRNFEALCKGLDRAGWLDNAKFATPQARLSHAQEMSGEVTAVVQTKSAEQWLAILEPLGVLCAPVNDYQAFMQDPQVKAMQIFAQVQQPGLGSIPLPRHPGMQVPPAPAPRLGEHSRQVLQALGVDEGQIQSLIDTGVVRLAQDPQEQV